MGRILFNWAIAAAVVLAPAVAAAGDKEDKATAEQIATILRDSGQMQNYSVGVKYKNGTVWLSGRVTSNQQMQAALQVISDIEGIEQIVNSLQVGGPGLKQPMGVRAGGPMAASKGSARRASASGADLAGRPMNAVGAEAMEQGDDVAPAGYHAMAARHAARNAGPPPMYAPGGPGGGPPPAYDQPHMPNYAWPSYAAYPNYAALTYPKQYSPTAFPFIGPFYPYPQVPLGWRKVSLEWDDGWWFLDFYDRSHH
jgi:hypothetical protein